METTIISLDFVEKLSTVIDNKYVILIEDNEEIILDFIESIKKNGLLDLAHNIEVAFAKIKATSGGYSRLSCDFDVVQTIRGEERHLSKTSFIGLRIFPIEGKSETYVFGTPRFYNHLLNKKVNGFIHYKRIILENYYVFNLINHFNN